MTYEPKFTDINLPPVLKSPAKAYPAWAYGMSIEVEPLTETAAFKELYERQTAMLAQFPYIPGCRLAYDLEVVEGNDSDSNNATLRLKNFRYEPIYTFEEE